MNKKAILASAIFLGGIAVVHADIVSNLLVDAGFEAINGNEPNATTSPWFTMGEGSAGSFVTATNQMHGGSQSAKFAYYYDDGAIVQNTGTQIAAGKDYEISMWMRYGEPSSNSNHTNAPTMNMSIYVSDTVDGTYTWAKGIFGNLPSAEDTWEQFSGTFEADDLTAHVGKFLQVRFAKANQSASHRIWIDDVSFGEVVPEPATLSLVALVGMGLFAVRRIVMM